MKQFTFPLTVEGEKLAHHFYADSPHDEFHPLHHQLLWFKYWKGSIELHNDILVSLDKLQKISVTNNVNFGELLEYALKPFKSAHVIEVETFKQLHPRELHSAVQNPKNIVIDFAQARIAQKKMPPDKPEKPQTKLLMLNKKYAHRAIDIVSKFSAHIIPDHVYQFAAARDLLTGLIFERSLFFEGQDLMQDLKKFLHMPHHEVAYNIAVLLDVWGKNLEFSAFHSLTNALTLTKTFHGKEVLFYLIFIINEGLLHYARHPIDPDVPDPFNLPFLEYELGRWGKG